MLLVAIGVFVLGAVLCGLAQSMPELIAYRAIQGAGGGGLMIGAQAIIGEIVSPRERGRYLGLLGVVYVFAAVGGPLIGGFLVDHLNWRWIFALYPLLGVLALVAAVRTLRLPFRQAVPPVFGFVAPLLGLAFVLAIALPARPLRTSAHIDAERT